MILRNAIRGKLCGDVIKSTYRYDSKWCKCGSFAVEELSVSIDFYEYNGEYLYEEYGVPDWILDALYTDKSIYYDNSNLWVNDKMVSTGDYIVLGNDGKIKVFTYDELNLEIERLLKELPS